MFVCIYFCLLDTNQCCPFLTGTPETSEIVHLESCPQPPLPGHIRGVSDAPWECCAVVRGCSWASSGASLGAYSWSVRRRSWGLCYPADEFLSLKLKNCWGKVCYEAVFWAHQLGFVTSSTEVTAKGRFRTSVSYVRLKTVASTEAC